MKRINVLAVFVGLAAITVFSPKTFGMFHPRQARFLQRDPSGYADGMSLYEYVGSDPANNVDPSGQVMVVMSGLRSSYKRMEPIRRSSDKSIHAAVRGYTCGPVCTLHITSFFEGKSTGAYERALRSAWRAFLSRKQQNPCSLEQFVAIGHSSGASAIYNEILRGNLAKTYVKGTCCGKKCNVRIQPAFLGMVEMILYKPTWGKIGPDLVRAREKYLGAWTTMIHYKLPTTAGIKGVLNKNIKWKTHWSILDDNRVITGLAKLAASAYAYAIAREIRQCPSKEECKGRLKNGRQSHDW